MGASVHIHNPAATAKAIMITVCLDCKRRTRMLQFFTPWYGWDSTCIRCGRRWADGEWLALAFMPKSREKSIERAKARWRAMPPMADNYYDTDCTQLIEQHGTG